MGEAARASINTALSGLLEPVHGEIERVDFLFDGRKADLMADNVDLLEELKVEAEELSEAEQEAALEAAAEVVFEEVLEGMVRFFIWVVLEMVG
ncbi:hypothetical protein FQN50_006661 [Emmonsiellopsis sp. PD_5]|nr:hypothetical protein FQN50_006661 [Emmonsiellopsis sp. PD_5]